MRAIPKHVWALAALFLVVMTGLMWQPIHEESATSDEAAILTAGYSYGSGYGFRMHPDEPPLAKMWSALPLHLMDVSVSRGVDELLNFSSGHPLARTWMTEMKPVETLFPSGRNNWYAWPWFEVTRAGNSSFTGTTMANDYSLRDD